MDIHNNCIICHISLFNKQVCSYIYNYQTKINCSTADEEHSVFCSKASIIIIFFSLFVSSLCLHDAHLRTQRRRSSVFGKCRSVPPSIFV